MKKLLMPILLILVIIWQMNAQTQAELQKAFEESYALESEQQYQRAIDVLKKVYQPQGYETNLRLGWLHYTAGLHTDALIYYQKCIQLRPLSLEAKFGYVLPAAALEHWDKVLQQYLAILDIDQYNTKANFHTGQIYYYRADYAPAEKYFQKVVNLYPFDYDSLLMLAWTKYFLGKTTEAKALFQKVLLYAPGDESATEGIALIK